MKARLMFNLILAVTFGACSGLTYQTTSNQPTSVEVKQSAPAIREVRPETTALIGEEENQASAVPSIASEDSQPLAARVNGQPIYLATYAKQVAQIEHAYAEQGVDLSSVAGQQLVSQSHRNILESLIDQVIIEQQAARLGIAISEEELKAKVRDSIGQAQNQAQFEAWLVANNLTLEEFESTLRSQLITKRVFSHLTGDVPDVAEQIHVRQILVADRETALAIIRQLKNGAEFGVLAREHSLDENSRIDGGDLGWLPRGLERLPIELESAAFSLEVGQVSGPILTAHGFHIIKLENREAERPLTNDLLLALKKKAFSDWLMAQRSSTMIERFTGK